MTKAIMGVDWTQDPNDLDKYINALSLANGQTALFDAIRSMAEALKTKVNSDKDYNDRIIILITDGDQFTQLKGWFVSYPDEKYERKKQIEGLIKGLKQAGIKVYAVGLLGELNAYGSFDMTQKERAESFLKKITKETGGKAVISMSTKIDINKTLDELFAK